MSCASKVRLYQNKFSRDASHLIYSVDFRSHNKINKKRYDTRCHIN